MDWYIPIVMVASVVASYMIGRLNADLTVWHFKRENERLNAELTRLTDRDERGRFKGGK